jgi:hypothetical protein
VFDEAEAGALTPLPASVFTMAEWARAKVAPDVHVFSELWDRGRCSGLSLGPWVTGGVGVRPASSRVDRVVGRAGGV